MVRGAPATAPPHSVSGLSIAASASGANLALATGPVVRSGSGSVTGPTLFPASLQEARFWGLEPGGGQRVVIAGVRVVVHANGALAAAADRLPRSPSSVLHLPERLGGGFVYVVGSELWRSQTWLSESVPIFSSPSPIDRAFVGLDRIYVRLSPGSLAALDPRSGRLRELGPLPSAPSLGQLVALDAWRALVVADLRGPLVTSDAGASWHAVSLPLPLEPNEVVRLEDGFGVAALDANRHEQWWLVRANGRSESLAEAPVEEAAPTPAGGPTAPFRRIFDEIPLAVAIEDGWPLRDGTALIARDGALARVRMSDGAVIEFTDGAFPLSPAKCHGLSLASPGDVGAFGFVCGESRGETRIYAWDATLAKLVELRRFGDAREVAASGNGALVVRGGCSDRTEAAAIHGYGTAAQTFCVMRPARTWKEVRFQTDRPERVQPVVLSDGQLVLLRPPTNGDLTTARLTFVAPTDSARMADVPVRFAPLDRETGRVLRLGTWMDGFEERRPGVLGGWVDSGGSALGIEIDVNGGGRTGEYIRDAGAPVVSSRWAFGWTASRGGFESTDGGMTWTKELPLPEPIAEPRAHVGRVCGPLGCMIAGWLRVGWGGRERPPAVTPRPFRPAPPWGASRTLRLVCAPSRRPPALLGKEPAVGAAPSVRTATGDSPGGPLNASRPGQTAADPPSFSGPNGPALATSDLHLTAEGSGGLERSMRFGTAVRLYAWGPSSGEWDALGRWQVRWDWPWGGRGDSRASAVVPSPWSTFDAARRALLLGAGPPPTVWSLVAGDDPDHALLVARHGSTAELIVLEAERAPLRVQHDGEDAFPEPQSALRVGGRWFVATSQPQADPPATVLWTLDGSTARELLRVPRAGFDASPDARLARRADARAIGLLAEGRPDLTKPVSLWLAPVDLESGSIGEPQPIGPPGIVEPRICAAHEAEEAGWDSDVPYPGPGAIELSRDDSWSAPLQTPTVRLHVSRDGSCIERIFGSIDPYGSSPPAALVRSAVGAAPGDRGLGVGPSSATPPPSLEVSVFSARARFPLRCWAR